MTPTPQPGANADALIEQMWSVVTPKLAARMQVQHGDMRQFEAVITEHCATSKADRTLRGIIREAIQTRVKQFGGNKSKAAKSLKCGRITVYENMKAIAATILLMSAIWSHAQRGTMEFVKYDFADKLTWVNGSNAWPVYTEIQGQAGDKVWRTVATVRDAQSITLPRTTRTMRYRISHVFEVTGARSTWTYKSTK